MRSCLVGLILCTSLLMGCAQMQVQEATDQGRAPELVIASDLVNALMQVDGYHPNTTRLQFQKTSDSFGEILNAVLVGVDYDIQYVDSPIGDRFVQYTVSNHQNSQSSVPKTYHLSVGEVEFKRDYETVRGRVQPASNLLMAGVDPMSIKLNDQIFGLGAVSDQDKQAELDEQVELDEQPGQTIQVESAPVREPAQQQLVQATTPLQHVSNVQQASLQLDSTIDLLVNGESSPSSYAAGDNLIFTIRTQVDVRLSCYYQDPDGSVMRLYPNRFAKQSNIGAGQLVHIPANDAWSLEATRAGANDEVMCLSVDPALETAMSEFESAPDLEPLSFSSFDELLSELKLHTGITPQTQRVSIRVN